MSAIKIISRIAWIFVLALILAVLVWRFAYPGDFFYYAIGSAVVIASLAGFFIFRIGRTTWGKEKPNTEAASLEEEAIEKAVPIETIDSTGSTETASADEETIHVEEDYTDIPPLHRKRMEGSNKCTVHRLGATEGTSGYRSMAGNIKQEIVSDPVRPSILADSSSAKPAKPEKSQSANYQYEEKEEETLATEPVDQKNAENGQTTEPPIPMIEDESSLTMEEINELVNAVWYRCENPYCKYTSFLTVHHFVNEKDGGTNKLDNLIVLCPYCHDLAHKNEMPEKEMHEWIDREDRFKSKPDWRH
jgi:hypothetical protein